MESDGIAIRAFRHAEAAVSDQVLTIKEVAALRRLAEKTVYAMANAGQIPAFKIRGQ